MVPDAGLDQPRYDGGVLIKDERSSRDKNPTVTGSDTVAVDEQCKRKPTDSAADREVDVSVSS